MKSYMKKTTFVITAFLSISIACFADVTLPGIFSDNMVLQRNSAVRFYGWAKTGEDVLVSAGWLSQPLKATADPQGTWLIVINTPGAGGPYDISIKGHNEILIKNVMIGEVWLCSGQSNMEWKPSSGITGKDAEIAAAKFPGIRFFSVNHSTSLYPQDHVSGRWVECTPETMADFSAIGYFFGRKLHTELGMPVGIINSSWGGTPAEAWMPEKVISSDPVLSSAAAIHKPVPWGPVEPGRIFNSMINPLTGFTIAGALWYQGEANTDNGQYYKDILVALIKAWRTQWGYEFPFYYAQIAPWKYGRPFEGAVVRDAQRRVLSLPNTAMVVTSDIGDTVDIHPKNKLDVGLRFAHLALNRVYGKGNGSDSGPLFREFRIEKDKVIVYFDNSEGLSAPKGKPSLFEVAGSDGIFRPASAVIKGNTVIVQSAKVKEPLKVRFAWGNTATPDLFNGAGLPASCFTTEY